MSEGDRKAMVEQLRKLADDIEKNERFGSFELSRLFNATKGEGYREEVTIRIHRYVRTSDIESHLRVCPSRHIRDAIVFLLVRIGSWTNSRFDQQLRHEFGDEITNETMQWLKENVSPSLGKGPLGEPMYRTIEGAVDPKRK